MFGINGSKANLDFFQMNPLDDTVYWINSVRILCDSYPIDGISDTYLQRIEYI